MEAEYSCEVFFNLNRLQDTLSQKLERFFKGRTGSLGEVIRIFKTKQMQNWKQDIKYNKNRKTDKVGRKIYGNVF
jgi:hypothetical protein